WSRAWVVQRTGRCAIDSIRGSPSKRLGRGFVHRAEEGFCAPLIGWREIHSMAQWTGMARLWCDEGASIAGTSRSSGASGETQSHEKPTRIPRPGAGKVNARAKPGVEDP